MAKSSIFQRLFPVSKRDDGNLSPSSVENGGVMEPGVAAAFGPDGMPSSDLSRAVACATGGEVMLRRLPTERLEQYEVLRTMATDPTIDSAIKMHLSQALAPRQDTGEIIQISGVEGDDDHIVADLRDTFAPMVNREVMRWAYTAALFGFNPLRVYGEPGKGVSIVRDDYYTHPFFTRRFERAGQLVGWSSRWQQTASGSNGKGMITLMEPWKFVEIRMPDWTTNIAREPIRHAGDVFDIGSDDYMSEGFVEAQDYGCSLVKTAYEPWIDLQEAILSLNMSRKNASNIERLIGVQTGKLNPQKAAQYLNTISAQMHKTARAQAEKSIRKGYVQTIWNHIIPIFSAGQGQLDISTLEGKPDIAYIEDIKFHVNRLGSAIGIDPSLLGFGEQLSGGLGDGGFFRMSVMAAMKAQAVRTAVHTMLDRLFEIHVALKYNKVFLETEKPWQISFHSLNTAIAKEYADERDRAATFGMTVTQLMQMINPNLGNVDINEFQRWLFIDLLRVDEDRADTILKKISQEEAEQALPGEGGDEFGGDEPGGLGPLDPSEDGEDEQPVTESAARLKAAILETLTELEAEKHAH